ncbi:hypothetical protein N7457_007005 [Penicillium paradoxum]|uniref:uncharacterized protein n=1 Tax=Penicillium paradoxum TaxID=176176 RepID=UPI0025469139|nr:uncharacterized protein N7457_007005 [Penicillium paradoxum]KAJ5779285.1 hypothetical protein N7457_007005 [Penicillium paradoxum]
MEAQPRRRRKPARSCIECRCRKIRCDRTDPCTPCVSAYAWCMYKTYADRLEVQSQHSSISTLITVAPSSSHVSLGIEIETSSARDHRQLIESRTATEIPTPTELTQDVIISSVQVHKILDLILKISYDEFKAWSSLQQEDTSLAYPKKLGKYLTAHLTRNLGWNFHEDSSAAMELMDGYS